LGLVTAKKLILIILCSVVEQTSLYSESILKTFGTFVECNE